MIPKKPVPDLIRDGNRFSDKIMRRILDANQRSDVAPSGSVAGAQQACELGAQDNSVR
jgi:hypothetical protein